MQNSISSVDALRLLEGWKMNGRHLLVTQKDSDGVFLRLDVCVITAVSSESLTFVVAGVTERLEEAISEKQTFSLVKATFSLVTSEKVPHDESHSQIRELTVELSENGSLVLSEVK